MRDNRFGSNGLTAGLTAVLACGLLLPLAIGCTSNEQLVRLDSEMDRLSSQVENLDQASAAKDGAQDRALRLLEERLNSMQQENASSLASTESAMNQLSALYSRMDDLESQLALANQKIEVLGNSLQRLERPRQEAPPMDEGSATDTGDPAGLPDAGSPEELYRSAFADYRRGNYELAVVGFKAFLEQFPTNANAGDAHYWLGECHYANGDFEQAIKSYDRVIQNHPQNSHVRGAYLKKGYAYIESNQVALGVVQLYHIIDNFPGTSEANLAQQRLEKMGLRRP